VQENLLNVYLRLEALFTTQIRVSQGQRGVAESR
jgi:hypothetical protein